MVDEGQRADQLSSADPTLWPVTPGWQPLADAFFQSPGGRQLCAFLRQRLDAGAVIFPPQPLRALQLTPPEAVRVVILGQDPYHGRGQAEGQGQGRGGRREGRRQGRQGRDQERRALSLGRTTIAAP